MGKKLITFSLSFLLMGEMLYAVALSKELEPAIEKDKSLNENPEKSVPVEVAGPAHPRSINVSLDEVVQLALHNSLDIQIAKLDAYIGRTSRGEVESLFDTFFNAQASYLHDKKEQPSVVFGSESREHSISLGVSKKMPTGTTLGVEASATKDRADSPFTTLNPYNEALVGVSLQQALGKNFFGLADRGSVKITKIDIENSDFLALDDIEGALFDVLKAYWNLVLRTEELTIAQDMREEAQKLYDIYQEKYSLGLVEESELLSVQALLLTRESSVELAKLNRETAKNDLLFLLNVGEFDYDIVPQDALAGIGGTVDLYAQMKGAVQYRRDYKRINNELKKNNIDIVLKQNALWPEIDIEASFRRNNLDSDRSQAWNDLNNVSHDEIFVGINVSLSFENNQAKAQLKKTQLLKEQLLFQLKRTERNILKELNNKVSQVNISHNQAELFDQTVGLHRKKLDQEVQRVSYGRSDADTLIRYEEDLFQAQLLLVNAEFNYKIALIELESAKDTLLDEYWQEPL